MPIYVQNPSGATSGVSDFTANRDTIVRRALRMVGAYTSTDLPRPEQLTDAISVLNTMLASWAPEGFLWLRQFIQLDLVAGQAVYDIGPDSGVPMERPNHIFTANRKSTSGNEIPMVSLTRTDYMAIPNKATLSTPVQYYYDPQTRNGRLYVWPVPAVGTTDVVILDCDRRIDLMVDNLNEFDFPPQWMDAIAYCLAAKLAPEYGMPLTERDLLRRESELLYNRVANDDRDIASIHFGVRKI